MSEEYVFNGRTPDYSYPFDDANRSVRMIMYGDLGVGPIG